MRRNILVELYRTAIEDSNTTAAKVFLEATEKEAKDLAWESQTQKIADAKIILRQPHTQPPAHSGHRSTELDQAREKIKELQKRLDEAQTKRESEIAQAIEQATDDQELLHRTQRKA
jgi:hypothetical protein